MGLKTTIKTIKISIIVGTSLITLKNLEDLVFWSKLKSLRSLDKYKWYNVNKITNNNFSLIQVVERTSKPKEEIKINPNTQVKIIAGVMM